MAAILQGKSCLVTGSTSGIGKELAAGLVRLGADVMVVGRSESRCRQAADDIASKTNAAREKIHSFSADLSSQAGVRRLAQHVESEMPALHVLVNNAGVFTGTRSKTEDGIETTLATNHLAPFLLTGLLLGCLKSAGEARVVTTSSIAHRGARIDFDDINYERKRFSGIGAYSQSKLANILFTRELARRLLAADTKISANCFHPGAVRTNLLDKNPFMYRLAWGAASPFMTSPEQGAATGIYLASSPEVAARSGGYYVKQKQVVPSAAAQDTQSAERLWLLSEQLTGFKFQV